MTKFSRLFLFTGLLQGFALWWLNYSRDEHLWPFDSVVRISLLFFAVVTPLVIYWTQNVDQLPTRFRWLAVIKYGISFALLGAYLQWAGGDENLKSFDIPFSSVVASAFLCFVGINLLAGFDFAKRRWQYDQFFHYLWRNGMLVVIAIIITAGFWIVLYAGATLMELINIKWIGKLISKPIFGYPATALVVSGAFALGLSRSTITESTQRFALFIASWLLALLLLFSVVWVVALPFEGLKTLLATKHAGSILCWFLAVAIALASCVYQDGKFKLPYSIWISRALQFAWFSTIPMAAILCWVLYLRVNQYGWTEARLWSALITVMAFVCAVGYSLSWFDRSRWMSMVGRTNIVASIILCLGVLAFLTPIADINRLSVASHMSRVHAGAGSVVPDWLFLRYRSGRFGREELAKLAKGDGVPAGSNWQKLAVENLTPPKSPRLTPNAGPVTAAHFAVVPKGLTLPPSFLDYARSAKVETSLAQCINFQEKCTLWMGDLKGNGQNDIVYFHSTPVGNSGVLFSLVGNEWKMIGRLSGDAAVATRVAPITDEQLEKAQTQAPEWKDLVIADKRYRVFFKAE